jgi:hypothetical protein
MTMGAGLRHIIDLRGSIGYCYLLKSLALFMGRDPEIWKRFLESSMSISPNLSIRGGSSLDSV